MNKIIKTLYILGVVFLISTYSCTDLEETVYSEVLTEDFYTTQDEIVSALAPAYGDLRNLITLWATHGMNAYSTDETILPTRGRHWYDGGIYQRMHEHTWTPETGILNTAWGHQFQLVSRSNMLIYQFANLDNMDADLKAAFTAELKCIRALGYFYLINNFGNVPIVDRFDVEEGFSPPNNSDFNAGLKDVFDFIETDLVDNVEFLDDAVNSDTYGRFNKYAAAALLTKFYMMAEKWSGTPRWDDAIKYADMIIESGEYQLEANYFANFVINNESSKENIFAVPYDEFRTGNSWGSAMTVVFYLCAQHHTGNKIFDVPHAATSGGSALPSHYRSFDENDLRRNGWDVGPQYNKLTGEQVLCTEESAPLPLEYTIDFIDITDPNSTVVYDHKNSLEYQGARISKYEIDYDGNGMPNDYAMFRYADILLLKAEALMRKNGGAATQEAVDLVNQVRARAFRVENFVPYTTETLTLDSLLQERSWELYYEGWRRMDLIRFDKFVRGTWEFYDRSQESDTKNYFPIPTNQMSSNPNLTQNPGY